MAKLVPEGRSSCYRKGAAIYGGILGVVHLGFHNNNISTYTVIDRLQSTVTPGLQQAVFSHSLTTYNQRKQPAWWTVS